MPKKLLIAGVLATAAVGASGVAIADGGNGTDAIVGDPHFIALDEIAVPIVGSDRIEGTLRVKLVVEAADAESVAIIENHLPALRATSVAAMIEFSRLHASALAAVNAERLKADMTAALTQEHAAIARVLVVEVIAQRA